jgi:SAM-dependent methyltransferase
MSNSLNRWSVGDIPFWKGAQLTPEINCQLFEFERDDAGMIRQRHSKAADEAIASYGSDDYYFQTSPPGSSEWGNQLAERSLDGVRRTCGDIQGIDVLEVGGGTLYNARKYLEEMNAASVTLVDPAVQGSADKDAITIHRQYFDENVDLGRKFPRIISLCVLEHVPDPESFLRAIHDNLSDDGLAFIKVPECEGSLAHGDLGLCVHEHISYFTHDSLDTLMERAGLERVIEANYMGHLQVAAKKTTPNPSVICETTASLLEKFSRSSLANIERLNDFAQKNEGGRVAFIGASGGLANVLSQTEVNKKMDVEVFDSDSLKTDRYLPGFDKPIRHISDPGLEDFTDIFVSPINFYNEIVTGLRAREALSNANIMPVFSIAQ